VPKHVGILIIVMNCILLSAFVGGYSDCKNMHGMNIKIPQQVQNIGKIKSSEISSQFSASLIHMQYTFPWFK
jgi:hypothetical protein